MTIDNLTHCGDSSDINVIVGSPDSDIIELRMRVDRLTRKITAIQDRNRRVELDKAIERSWLRRGFITAITYGAAVGLLVLINAKDPYLAAIVPTGAYLLSTLGVGKKVTKIWDKYFHSSDNLSNDSSSDSTTVRVDALMV